MSGDTKMLLATVVASAVAVIAVVVTLVGGVRTRKGRMVDQTGVEPVTS